MVRLSTAVFRAALLWTAALGPGLSPASLAWDQPAATTEAEAAIRATAAEYGRAFAAADAKALGALWTEDAEYTNEFGAHFQGREAIVRHLFQNVAGHPGTTVSIDVRSIRLLAPEVAVETGTSLAKPPQGPDGSPVRYTAVHVKRQGKWLVSNLTESHHSPASDRQHLKELAWLVGDWRAVDGKNIVLSQYTWLPGNTFLCHNYRVTAGDDGQAIASGLQIIGWDPLLRQIASWSFDSTGGHGSEAWSQAGARWEIRTSSVLPDGRTALATNILKKLDGNTFTWQSIERSANGALLPDTNEVRVRRGDK